MLTILVIFLLVQVLSATNEFPDLMQNVKVLWDGVDISSQLDARLTSSLDKQVDYFLLCGPWQTLYRGGNCSIESYYETHYTETNITRNWGYWGSDINLLGDYYRNNIATIMCAAFPNNIPDFMDHKQYMWSVNYTCETTKFIPKPNPKPESKLDSKPIYVVGMITVMAVIGFVAFKVGQKKGAESSQGSSSGAYKALGANNKVHGGNPSYGNPFAQTA